MCSVVRNLKDCIARPGTDEHVGMIFLHTVIIESSLTGLIPTRIFEVYLSEITEISLSSYSTEIKSPGYQKEA